MTPIRKGYVYLFLCILSNKLKEAVDMLDFILNFIKLNSCRIAKFLQLIVVPVCNIAIEFVKIILQWYCVAHWLIVHRDYCLEGT